MYFENMTLNGIERHNFVYDNFTTWGKNEIESLKSYFKSLKPFNLHYYTYFSLITFWAEVNTLHL